MKKNNKSKNNPKRKHQSKQNIPAKPRKEKQEFKEDQYEGVEPINQNLNEDEIKGEENVSIDRNQEYPDTTIEAESLMLFLKDFIDLINSFHNIKNKMNNPDFDDTMKIHLENAKLLKEKLTKEISLINLRNGDNTEYFKLMKKELEAVKDKQKETEITMNDLTKKFLNFTNENEKKHSLYEEKQKENEEKIEKIMETLNSIKQDNKALMDRMIKMENEYKTNFSKLREEWKEFSDEEKDSSSEETDSNYIETELKKEEQDRATEKNMLSNNKHIFHANVRIMLEALIANIFIGDSSLSNREKVEFIFKDLSKLVLENENSNLIDQKLVQNIPESVKNFFRDADQKQMSDLFLMYGETNKHLHLNDEINYKGLMFPKEFKERIQMINDILKIYQIEFTVEFYNES